MRYPCYKRRLTVAVSCSDSVVRAAVVGWSAIVCACFSTSKKDVHTLLVADACDIIVAENFAGQIDQFQAALAGIEDATILFGVPLRVFGTFLLILGTGGLRTRSSIKSMAEGDDWHETIPRGCQGVEE